MMVLLRMAAESCLLVGPPVSESQLLDRTTALVSGTMTAPAKEPHGERRTASLKMDILPVAISANESTSFPRKIWWLLASAMQGSETSGSKLM